MSHWIDVVNWWGSNVFFWFVDGEWTQALSHYVIKGSLFPFMEFHLFIFNRTGPGLFTDQANAGEGIDNLHRQPQALDITLFLWHEHIYKLLGMKLFFMHSKVFTQRICSLTWNQCRSILKYTHPLWSSSSWSIKSIFIMHYEI